MPLSRRSFLAAAAASAAFGGYASLARAQEQDEALAETYLNEVHGYGPLVEDPYRLLDLPEGFSYRVVSQAGEIMNDGFYVPYKADGMACFPGGGSTVILARNHELKPTDRNYGPLGVGRRLASEAAPARPPRLPFLPGRAPAPAIPAEFAYDHTDDGAPLPGGVTLLRYDLASRRLIDQRLALTGTAVNCAGGATPWGSWLTCEETTLSAGRGVGKDHGWVFEVPANARGLVRPEPLKAMGRFMHEAACVDPRTGVVYMTEDVSADHKSLFYRFLPQTRGQLNRGGRLQALGFRSQPEGGDSRNRESVFWKQGDWQDAVWIDLDGVDNPYDDLRHRGHAKGAALFARGEGIHFGDGELYFTCTSGGAPGLGQIMRYVPSPREGQSDEASAPGRIQLFLEPTRDTVLDYGDNLTVAPNGHLIVCEDRYSDELRNHIKGVTPDGKVYALARNVFRDNAEVAGVCFSPDGSTLFVNVYWPGITLAITGPWSEFRG